MSFLPKDQNFVNHSLAGKSKSLRCHLAEKNVSYLPISSPPVLSIHQKHDTTGSNYSLSLIILSNSQYNSICLRNR
ncbi:hypothetical protein RchiOBHm_Chr5g0032441 [Rosa chinensis]|uniref:Uncharacterized protein n=1 Tax=Rosa chinensis TaxID=74649 RepID=A0A2P6QAF4_ROSCH|nr:hypothetical protein RchiOBHm_Chr5g0032441 [Rosa chinensis]